jgi:hypothetical protein
MPNIDYPLFVQLLKTKEDNKQITREKATNLRNIVSTIARPACPKKMVDVFARQVNFALGTEVVKL